MGFMKGTSKYAAEKMGDLADVDVEVIGRARGESVLGRLCRGFLDR